MPEETDQLPDIVGSGGYKRETVPVIIVAPDGSLTSPSGGQSDPLNSSLELVASAESFVGQWVQNEDPQIAFNVLTDQPGILTLEFSIDGSEPLTSLTKTYQVYPNSGEFDSLVKMPGRFHRVSFENTGSTQTKFGLITATGDGLYPFAISNRNAPKLAALSSGTISSTSYKMLVDLSDRDNWPHHFTGHITLFSSNILVDRANNAQGNARIGVITAIDGTEATIALVQGISFTNASETSINRDRVFPAPISLRQSDGELLDVASGFSVTTSDINTGVTLETSLGDNVTPAVGDLIAVFTYTSGGNFNSSISVQYSTESA